MARWVPGVDDPVGPNEPIGRRLFDEPMLVGAIDQIPYNGLILWHFEEKRGSEVSLDRLGKTGIEKAVLKYLNDRGVYAGQKFKKPKKFDGWATVRAKELEAPRVGIPLPVIQSRKDIKKDQEVLEENVYHAHVEFPDDKDYYDTALHLRHLFTTHGEFKAPLISKRPSKNMLIGLLKGVSSTWKLLTFKFGFPI